MFGAFNLGRREGNFVITPDARLADGWFDYIHAADLRRWEMLRFLPGMVTGDVLVSAWSCSTVVIASPRFDPCLSRSTPRHRL